jgi:hypothetical protein
MLVTFSLQEASMEVKKKMIFMFTSLDMSTLIIVPFTDTIVNEGPNVSHGACAMEDIPKTLSSFNEEIWLKISNFIISK